MVTTDLVLDALKRFDVDAQTLTRWEDELGLSIPVDASGQKCYSIHHVNLFKNVRKHLALGRSMTEIREVLSPLPEVSELAWQQEDSSLKQTPLIPVSVNRENAYSSRIQWSFSPEALACEETVLQEPELKRAVSQALSEVDIESSLDLIFAREATASLLHQPETATEESQTAEPEVQASNPDAVIPGSSIKHHKRFVTKLPSSTSQHDVPSVMEEDAPGGILPEVPLPVFDGMSPPSHWRYLERGAVSLSRTVASANLPAHQSGLLSVINRLIDEKQVQQKRVVQIEKLNSHLYNANALFQQRLKTLTSELDSLRNSVSDTEVTKLLNDKSKLHKQLLETERVSQHRLLELTQREKDVESLETRMEQLLFRIENPMHSFDPACFVGDWQEQGQLLCIRFDNFGMNIEPRRSRTFKIQMVPEQCYGNTAVIHTEYAYDANPMWQRRETMTLCHIQEGHLQGQLVADYILDGVPVAQAVYQLNCQKLPG
ncbi:MAG: MerR family transcriptional regulator [Vampirovibrionales bacterium]|nr:MerR family transcriptional regulator [Vampirovibrionales bacterium]